MVQFHLKLGLNKIKDVLLMTNLMSQEILPPVLIAELQWLLTQ